MRQVVEERRPLFGAGSNRSISIVKRETLLSKVDILHSQGLLSEARFQFEVGSC